MGGIVKSVGGALGFGTSTGGVNGAADLSGDEAFRNIQLLKQQEANQKNFADQLYNQAAGKAPSIAEAQMRQAQDRSLAQQVAAAKSNRSANAGLLARNQAMNSAAANQQTNQAAGVARLQEALANQGQYQNYLTGMQTNVGNLLGVNNQAQNNAFNANQSNDKTIMTGGSGFLQGLAGGIPTMMNMFGGGGSTGTVGEGGNTQLESSASKFATHATPLAFAHGGMIPGKAAVKGDSPANDIKTVNVSPGEVVVPRSVVAKGHKASADFIQAVAKAQPISFGELVAAHAHLKSLKEKKKA